MINRSLIQHWIKITYALYSISRVTMATGAVKRAFCIGTASISMAAV